MTADLAITYFDSLRKQMDDLKLSQDSYWFVVSGGGRILAHAIDDQEFPAASADLTRRYLDSSQHASPSDGCEGRKARARPRTSRKTGPRHSSSRQSRRPGGSSSWSRSELFGGSVFPRPRSEAATTLATILLVFAWAFGVMGIRCQFI